MGLDREMLAEYERLSRAAAVAHGDRTVLLLQVGSFYEMYWVPGETAGADAADAARSRLGLTCMRRKDSGPPTRKSPCAAGFPMHAADKMDALLDDGWTVCVGEQVPGSQPVRRELTRCVSPSMRPDSGSAVERRGRSGNYAACVLERKGVVGVAMLDVATGRSVVTDGDGLTAAAQSRNVTEVVLVGYGGDARAAFPGATGTHVLDLGDPRVRDALSECMVRDVLDAAFGRRSAALTEDYLLLGSRPEGRDALAYLLTFTRRHSLALGVGLPPPDVVDSTSTLNSSPGALAQLGVLQLDALLNRAVTPPGRRWFRHRLCTPAARPDDIDASLDAVAAAIASGAVDAVRAELAKTGDLERLTRRVLQGALPLASAEQTVQQLEAVALAATAAGAPDAASAACAFADALQRALPSDAPFSGDAACVSARTAADAARASLDAARAAVHKDARLDVSADGNYRLLLTNTRFKTLSVDARAGLTATQLAGGMRLWSVSLQALADGVRDADVELRQALDASWGATLDAAPIASLSAAADWARDADVSYAAAWVATEHGHVRPELLRDEPGGTFRATALGNPVAEAAMARYTTERYVPNDVCLDGTTQHTLLLGENSCGKSTLLRAIGLCVVMAQAGLYAPCAELRLSPFTRVDTRILTPDDVERGLSSFTAEVMEARAALAAAGPGSLLLADELFCSTEWRSGTALVGTLICALGDRGTRTFVTTHYHELLQHPGVTGLDTLRVKHLGLIITEAGMTYERRLRDGPCNPNYGILVASAFGFDAGFIREATAARDIISGAPGAKRSRYNRRVVVSTCEACGAPATDSHHLQHRADAVDGRHGTTPEHHVSNLMALCEGCHRRAHAPAAAPPRRVHTLRGPAVSSS